MKILIIGASGGIGSVIAKRFPEAVCPSHKTFDVVNMEGRSIWYKSEQGYDDQFDVLIYCAGINHINTYSLEEIQQHFEVNALGFYNLASKLKPRHAIAISSLYAHKVRKGRLPYAVSKAALEQMIRCLAVELAPDILVNGIAPGFVDTALTRKNNTMEQQLAIINATPLQKMIPAEEIADLVEFLVYKNKSMTGQILTIDGGYSL